MLILDTPSTSSDVLRATVTTPIDTTLLRSAQIRGDYPTSLNLFNKITALKPGQSELLIKQLYVDHFLALRFLSIANHDHYGRPGTFMSISEAVQHLGLEQSLEIVHNLAEPKNLNIIYLRGAVALTMLQQAIFSSAIARQLIALLSDRKDLAEHTYITTLLANSGAVLLSYYYPEIYSAICLESLANRSQFEQGIGRVLNRSLAEFGAKLASFLSLPAHYVDYLQLLDAPPWSNVTLRQAPESIRHLIYSVYASNMLAHEIYYGTGIQGLQALLRNLDVHTPFELSSLEDVVGTAPNHYLKHAATLELKAMRIPEYLLWFVPTDPETEAGRWQQSLPEINERINPFLYELREIFRQPIEPTAIRRLPHAVYCTLSALTKGLNFDRAVFLSVESQEQYLQIDLCLGVKIFESEKIPRSINNPKHDTMPDVQALIKRTTVFEGEPIFRDGWPFVAFPVIWRDQVIGVFYADKIRRPENDAIDAHEQIACIALAKEWQELDPHFA